jgi:hypothetical protein
MFPWICAALLKDQISAQSDSNIHDFHSAYQILTGFCLACYAGAGMFKCLAAMNLNRKQRWVVVLAASLVVAMLYPPWFYEGHNGAPSGYGYAFIFLEGLTSSPARIDFERLLMECGCIFVAAIAGLIVLK